MAEKLNWTECDKTNVGLDEPLFEWRQTTFALAGSHLHHGHRSLQLPWQSIDRGWLKDVREVTHLARNEALI